MTFVIHQLSKQLTLCNHLPGWEGELNELVSDVQGLRLVWHLLHQEPHLGLVQPLHRHPPGQQCSLTRTWWEHFHEIFPEQDEYTLICTTWLHSPGHRHRASFPASWLRWCLLDRGLFLAELLPRKTACTESRCSPLCQTSWARWQRRSWWSPCTRSARGHWEGYRQVWPTQLSGSSRPSGPCSATTSPWSTGSRSKAARPRCSLSWCSSLLQSGTASFSSMSHHTLSCAYHWHFDGVLFGAILSLFELASKHLQCFRLGDGSYLIFIIFSAPPHFVGL